MQGMQQMQMQGMQGMGMQGMPGMGQYGIPPPPPGFMQFEREKIKERCNQIYNIQVFQIFERRKSTTILKSD